MMPETKHPHCKLEIKTAHVRMQFKCSCGHNHRAKGFPERVKCPRCGWHFKLDAVVKITPVFKTLEKHEPA